MGLGREDQEVFCHRGDSMSNWRLLTVLREGRPAAIFPDFNSANRELVNLLFREGAPAWSESWETLLFSRGAPVEHVPSSPLDRLLSPNEKRQIMKAFEHVLSTGSYTTGPEIYQLEHELRIFLQRRHVILTNSGTSAILIALLALSIQPGDEVIVPANSFAATENAVLSVGAIPVFADIIADSHTLDPRSIETRLSPKTRVILPVHLYGRMSEMQSIRLLADKHELYVLEDGCQSLGAIGLGHFGDLAVISLNPYKNFGVCGKGGAILTDCDELATRCRRLGYHGFQSGRKHFKVERFGLNAMMDNTQAAIALARLPFLSLLNFKRLFLAMRYRELLAPLEEMGKILLPKAVPNHVWHQFTIQLPSYKRDTLRQRLSIHHGVDTEILYPILSHQQQSARQSPSFSYPVLPVTENVHRRILQLPIFSSMTLTEQDHVVNALESEL
jgi:3-dehydro-glucose-6-phosphate---glutamate transaminase